MTTIDPKDAALALSDVDDIARRVLQSRIYQQSSLIITCWGVLVCGGYLVNQLWPTRAVLGWNVVYGLGIAATVAIIVLQQRRAQARTTDLRPMLAYLLFFGFGVLWSVGLAHFTPRQLSAFWASYFMLGYTLVGLWLGSAFVAIGLSISALTLVGYFYAGPWFDLWMAVVNGGGLILGGLWMRRS